MGCLCSSPAQGPADGDRPAVEIYNGSPQEWNEVNQGFDVLSLTSNVRTNPAAVKQRVRQRVRHGLLTYRRNTQTSLLYQPCYRKHREVPFPVVNVMHVHTLLHDKTQPQILNFFIKP